jgi:hypothetical protein
MPNNRHCRLLVSCIFINPSRTDFSPLGTLTVGAALQLILVLDVLRLTVGAKLTGERGQLHPATPRNDDVKGYLVKYGWRAA